MSSNHSVGSTQNFIKTKPVKIDFVQNKLSQISRSFSYSQSEVTIILIIKVILLFGKVNPFIIRNNSPTSKSVKETQFRNKFIYLTNNKFCLHKRNIEFRSTLQLKYIPSLDKLSPFSEPILAVLSSFEFLKNGLTPNCLQDRRGQIKSNFKIIFSS